MTTSPDEPIQPPTRQEWEEGVRAAASDYANGYTNSGYAIVKRLIDRETAAALQAERIRLAAMLGYLHGATEDGEPVSAATVRALVNGDTICPACGKPVDMTKTVLWGSDWIGHARCEGALAKMFPAEEATE